LAEEERDPEVILELPDACRHIGLDAVQALCGAGHAAFSNDGEEDAEIGKFHSSLPEIIFIIIIHFPGNTRVGIPRCMDDTHGSLAMTPEQIARVRTTWALVLPIADTAADLFYQHLFVLDPRLRLLFSNTDWPAQRRKLVNALNLALASLDRIEESAHALEALGSRHAMYGVQDAHYDTVREALIATLEKGLGDAWTPETAAAWKEAYDIVAGAMRRAQAPAVPLPATA